MERDRGGDVDMREICLTAGGQPAELNGFHACDSLTLTPDGLGCKKGIDVHELNKKLKVCLDASISLIPGRASVDGFEPRVDTAG